MLVFQLGSVRLHFGQLFLSALQLVHELLNLSVIFIIALTYYVTLGPRLMLLLSRLEDQCRYCF